MADESVGISRPKRAPSSPQLTAVATGATKLSRSSSCGAAAPPQELAASLSPQGLTPAREAQAEALIKRMRVAGIIQTRPPKTNVVACAIAMQTTAIKNDRKLKSLFGVARDTMVRRDWIEGGFINGEWVEAKLERLAQHDREARRLANSCTRLLATGMRERRAAERTRCEEGAAPGCVF